MGWRTALEDKYSVGCLGCGLEVVDPCKKPGQKYPEKCGRCGRTAKDNQRLARKAKKEQTS